MITESALKSNVVHLTGNVKFRTIPRKNQQGKHFSKLNVARFSYVLSFEVSTSKGKTFEVLHTNLNQIREFANLSSVEKFLIKLDIDLRNLEGTFSF